MIFEGAPVPSAFDTVIGIELVPARGTVVSVPPHFDRIPEARSPHGFTAVATPVGYVRPGENYRVVVEVKDVSAPPGCNRSLRGVLGAFTAD
ncbi:MAG TPA: hypothetical protein VGD01_00125 [Candidatus Elarobacter sp.]